MSDYFSARLKALRGTRKRAAFARFLGIPAPMYHRYENGQVPKENNLRVISEHCGVTIDWLLGRDEDAKRVPGTLLPETSPDRTYGAVLTREILMYRQAEDAWLEAEVRKAVEAIPGAAPGRGRLHAITDAIKMLTELQERCIDAWTGKRRNAEGKRGEEGKAEG